MPKTRGVFAVIFEDKKLLLSERQDGKGWNLPGGRVEEGEDDETALVREVREETGLDVEVQLHIGPSHVFNDDTALAYICKVIGGELTVTSEAKRHHYATQEEVRQGFYIDDQKVPAQGEEPVIHVTTFEKVPLKLIGPEGRLGRTGRMVWDGFSILEKAFDQERNPLPIEMPDYLTHKKPTMLARTFNEGETIFIWRRLDPYSPTGFMELEPESKPAT